MLDYASNLFTQRQAAEVDGRLAGYRKRREYYDGTQAQSLKTAVNQANDNLVINLCRYIVDKGAAFLFGKEVTWQLEEGDTTPAEETLKQIWQRNKKMTFLLKAATSGGIFGHVFIKILPDFYGNGIARLIKIDPEYVTVYYAGDDIETALGYCVQWEERDIANKSIVRRTIIMKDPDTGKWSENHYVSSYATNGQWRSDPQYPDIDPWPYPWAPMIDCQNIPAPDTFYGLSDLEDIDEQDALNFVASKINRILRYHSHPKTWGRGFDESQLQIDPDKMMIIRGTTGEIQNLEMQSDLSSSLAFYQVLQQGFMRAGRVPNLDPQTLTIGAQSGFALRILHGDLLEKTEAKRRTYGDMLIELNRRLLELAGHGDGNICRIDWQDPLPENAAERQTEDAFELDRGIVAKSTVQSRRGIDPETEDEKIVAESNAEDLRTGNVGSLILKQFNAGQGV
jgi:hypothetical protein